MRSTYYEDDEIFGVAFVRKAHRASLRKTRTTDISYAEDAALWRWEFLIFWAKGCPCEVLHGSCLNPQPTARRPYRRRTSRPLRCAWIRKCWPRGARVVGWQTRAAQVLAAWIKNPTPTAQVPDTGHCDNAPSSCSTSRAGCTDSQRVRWHVQHGGGSTTSQASRPRARPDGHAQLNGRRLTPPPGGRIDASRRWQRSWRPFQPIRTGNTNTFQNQSICTHSCGGDGGLGLVPVCDSWACGDWERQQRPSAGGLQDGVEQTADEPP